MSLGVSPEAAYAVLLLAVAHFPFLLGFAGSAFMPGRQYGNIPASSKPSYTVGGAGSDFNSNTLGTGLSVMTPSGTLTTTGGFNEAGDYIKSIGGGTLEVNSKITAAGQFIFRSTVNYRLNNLLITSTLAASNNAPPFISDPDAMLVNGDVYQAYLKGSDAYADVTILAAGSAGTSNTYNNTSAYYQAVAVIGGTVSSITINTHALTNVYGIIAVPPAGVVVTSYTANASPIIASLGATVLISSSQDNNFDMVFTNASGKSSTSGVTVCGWVAATGTDLGNHQGGFWMHLGNLNNAGIPINALRLMGAGGTNSDSCVNTTFGPLDLWFGTVASGGSGIDFAVHTDSNKFIGTQFIRNAGNSAAGSAIIFNDGTFVSSATDVRVNSNELYGVLFQPGGTNLTSMVTVTAGNSGVEGVNVVHNFSGNSTQTAEVSLTNGAIFNGHSQTSGTDWFNSVAATYLAESKTNAAWVGVTVTTVLTGWFDIHISMNITTATSISTTPTIVYTDIEGTQVTDSIELQSASGGLTANPITGANRYYAARRIYAKAGTSITVAPAAGGTYTTCVYVIQSDIVPVH